MKTSIFTRLMLLLVVSYIPIVVIIFWSYESQLQKAQLDVQEDAVQQAHEIALFYRQYIQQLEDMLLLLSQTHFIKAWDMELCMEVIPDMLGQFPNWSNIAVIDAEGTAVCSSIPETVGLSFLDRLFITEALQTGRVSYSGFLIGRVTGRATLAIAMPLLDSDNKIRGIIGIAVTLDGQSEYIAQEVLRPHYRMTIIDHNNTVLMAYPEPERWLGMRYDSDFVQQMSQANEGTFEAIGLDGQTRLFGFAAIESADSSVIVSIDKSIAFAEVNHVSQRNLIVLGLTFTVTYLLLMLASQVIAQPLKQFAMATEAFAKGDLSKRLEMSSGILEILQIQRAFNNMANSVKERIEARTAALEQEIQTRREVEAELADYTQRLAESNQELEHFAFIASHDMHEPLRKISVFSTLLERDNLGAEERQNYLKRLQNAAERMSQMIDNLLMYSRIERHNNMQSEVDLTDVAEKAVADLNLLIEEKQGRVDIGTLPTIRGDLLQMERLFQNLISNALKYNRQGVPPLVQVSAHEDEETMQIRIQDNGVGIAEADTERIFRFFERLHGRSDGGGTGLGLAICRKIVLHHGGTISVESRVGEGTAFVLNFPGSIKVVSSEA
jgi:signal transduction histidine kinase